MFDINQEGRSSLAKQFARGGSREAAGASPFVPNPERDMAVNSYMDYFRGNPEIMQKVTDQVKAENADKKLSAAELNALINKVLLAKAGERADAQAEREARMAGSAVYLSK